MDLWIRSQNRKMMERAVAVKIAHYKENGKMSNSIVINNDYIFGEYATEERTLEVLDEIQKKINLINLGHDFGAPMVDLKILHIFMKCQRSKYE